MTTERRREGRRSTRRPIRQRRRRWRKTAIPPARIVLHRLIILLIFLLLHLSPRLPRLPRGRTRRRRNDRRHGAELTARRCARTNEQRAIGISLASTGSGEVAHLVHTCVHRLLMTIGRGDCPRPTEWRLSLAALNRGEEEGVEGSGAARREGDTTVRVGRGGRDGRVRVGRRDEVRNVGDAGASSEGRVDGPSTAWSLRAEA